MTQGQRGDVSLRQHAEGTLGESKVLQAFPVLGDKDRQPRANAKGCVLSAFIKRPHLVAIRIMPWLSLQQTTVMIQNPSIFNTGQNGTLMGM